MPKTDRYKKIKKNKAIKKITMEKSIFNLPLDFSFCAKDDVITDINGLNFSFNGKNANNVIDPLNITFCDGPCIVRDITGSDFSFCNSSDVVTTGDSGNTLPNIEDSIIN